MDTTAGQDGRVLAYRMWDVGWALRALQVLQVLQVVWETNVVVEKMEAEVGVEAEAVLIVQWKREWHWRGS